MSLDTRRVVATLFNYETTMRTDFREPELTFPEPTVYKEKPERKRLPFTPPKYIGSMVVWKNYLPFNALHKPKDILQSYPLTPQQVFETVIDEHREEAQRTRPRLVMTPAVSLDDVTNKEDRDTLIRSMYSTEMKESLEKAAATCVSIKAPLPVFPAPANPVFLPKLKPKVVPEEWRMDSVSWDGKQLRSAVGATNYFWLQPENAPTRCKPCEQTKKVEENCYRKMMACQNNPSGPG